MGSHFTFIAKIPGDILLTKMPVELPSETSCLVPLTNRPESRHHMVNKFDSQLFEHNHGFKLRIRNGRTKDDWLGDFNSPHRYL